MILASLLCVDWVVKLPLINSNKGYLRLVQAIKPNVIAVTNGDSLLEQKKKQALQVGAYVKVVCDRIKELSSTKIINSFGK